MRPALLKKVSMDKERYFDNCINGAEGAPWASYIGSMICLFAKYSIDAEPET